ncbi:hypothetical protein AHAS_Ahas05G0146400 [Arachis hypogaea]
MEFTSSFSQTNFMGYCPPSQYDSSQYSNDGWEYHQEDTNSEHSNPWRFALEPQDEQENYEGYQPPPQNDSYHYPHGGWEYHQETTNSEQLNHMKNYPPSLPSFSFESSSSLDYASIQSFLQNPYKSSYQPQNSSHNSQNSFHTPQHNFTTTSQCQAIEIHRQLVKRHTQSQSWKKFLFKKMNKPSEQTRRNLEPSNREDEDQFMGEEVEKQDEEAFVSSEISMKNEVVEVFEPELAYSQKPLEMIKEHESSHPHKPP